MKKFIGNWIGGKQHGKGKIIDRQGVKKEGEWIDGVRVS